MKITTRAANFIVEVPPSDFVWSPGQLSSTHLPPLRAIILGTFQIVDICLSNKGDEASERGRVSRSHVDLCFGIEESHFAGAQRFSITREMGESAEQNKVQIHFESMACNPSVDSLGFLRFLGWFHDMYAELLFRETVYHVQRSLQRQPSSLGS